MMRNGHRVLRMQIRVSLVQSDKRWSECGCDRYVEMLQSMNIRHKGPLRTMLIRVNENSHIYKTPELRILVAVL